MENRQTIYSVSAKYVDRDVLLGYAIGHQNDILAYFDDKKAYGLVIEPVQPITIAPGYAAKRKELLKKKQELEQELRKIEQEIKNGK